ncbi:MAG TPA: alkaline phosphatase family protein [Oscillatoriaceae cyanobacterium]
MRRALLAILALLAAAPAIAAPAPKRVAVLGLSGAGEALFSRMLVEGAMPNLARMRGEGATVAYVDPGFAAQAASAQATLWTGAFADTHGIDGDWTPVPPAANEPITATMSGNDPAAFQAEPLFVTAARQGRRVLAFNIPQTTSLGAFTPGGRWGDGLDDRLAIVEGLSGALAPEGTWRLSSAPDPAHGWQGLPAHGPLQPLAWEETLGLDHFHLLLYDDPRDPTVGYDTCLMSRSQDARESFAVLKPLAPLNTAAWSAPVSVRYPQGLATTYFRLFALSPDGHEVMLYHTSPCELHANRPAWLPELYARGAALVPEGGRHAYLQGEFGRPLVEGGDGTAEARYLDTVRFALKTLSGSTQALVTQQPWDLFLEVLPFPGEIDAMWQGYLEPHSPAYLPNAARVLNPAMRQVFLDLDAFIGGLQRSLPAHTAFALVGDSGYAPARWDFLPNVVLRQAGLLALDNAGNIDFAHTRAMYAVQNGGYIIVNTLGRPGGIVPPGDVPNVLAQVRLAFKGLKVKAPGGIVPLVQNLQQTSPWLSRRYGLSSAKDRLYMELQPGYVAKPAWDGDAMYRQRMPDETGTRPYQFLGPERESLFFAVGDGIRRGALLPGIRGTDVAPTLARLLAIEAPAQATGRVIDGALAY